MQAENVGDGDSEDEEDFCSQAGVLAGFLPSTLPDRPTTEELEGFPNAITVAQVLQDAPLLLPCLAST